ncbi:aldo/keto reductase [uncultured Ruminococcus sp.]|uniref:aldo/keto reductase n=1 Tax=uncultured Ruminococcus sp. TaxID=165186 RepID=UPI0025D04C50|nr:aldo/keto reductase [uncultured Ruminococcus sp.]
MNGIESKAVIGTNSWGGKAYGKAIRGSYVENGVIKDAMREAEKQGLRIYDHARDYGLGKAQKMFGKFTQELGCGDIIVSAKYTPFTHYKKNCVRKSLEKDLADLKCEYIDIYWLHLPTDIEEHLTEIIELYHEGKIKHIGVSNFTLEECRLSKAILDRAGISLYGVQNHYSLISREWEKNGLLDWCKENGVSFWAWAVLEEGMLTDPRVKTKFSLLKIFMDRQKRKMRELYRVMIAVAKRHDITVPQVAEAYCANKGIVPICGCRKPKQVKELAEAVRVKLTAGEMRRLEEAADKSGAKVMGPDIFRFAVLKKRR